MIEVIKKLDDKELDTRLRSVKNATKVYNRSRKSASKASTKRCSEIDVVALHHWY
jgi:hypothetical protein